MTPIGRKMESSSLIVFGLLDAATDLALKESSSFHGDRARLGHDGRVDPGGLQTPALHEFAEHTFKPPLFVRQRGVFGVETHHGGFPIAWRIEHVGRYLDERVQLTVSHAIGQFQTQFVGHRLAGCSLDAILRRNLLARFRVAGHLLVASLDRLLDRIENLIALVQYHDLFVFDVHTVAEQLGNHRSTEHEHGHDRQAEQEGLGADHRQVFAAGNHVGLMHGGTPSSLRVRVEQYAQRCRAGRAGPAQNVPASPVPSIVGGCSADRLREPSAVPCTGRSH